jgi:transposase
MQLFKNSNNVIERNTSILYYDCTNYYFEIEQEDGLKQYGASKENRPNPIVQMGLFMDGNGIPLAFNINSGNTNEQVTMKPLEKKIIDTFDVSTFVVCTDAGLASNANRIFNNTKSRRFITTHSIKKSKAYLRDWMLDPKGWKIIGSDETFNLNDIDRKLSLEYDIIYYKERYINDNDLEQKIVVSFSVKYEQYQASIRNEQIERAKQKIQTNPKTIGKVRATDYKRFITTTQHTVDGETADKQTYSLNQKRIKNEAQYDGYYAVATNLTNDVETIIKANKSRWQIEQCFRIMKTEFQARPVYLRRDERIIAHFTTCFLSLMIYRILEQQLNKQFTTTQIITTLKEMMFLKVKGEGYIPTYKRNQITDALHDTFGFRTDYQINKDSDIKKIFKFTKQ